MLLPEVAELEHWHFVFDPTWPIDVHFGVESVCDEYPTSFGHYRLAVPSVIDWQGHCGLSDGDLALWVSKARECRLLPVSEPYMAVIDETLADLEHVANERRIKNRRRAEAIARFGESSWEAADLNAEVEAVCGQGKRMGKETWYRCPFHDDQNPSLEVNAEKKVWKCWGCDKKGGVTDWRRLQGGK